MIAMGRPRAAMLARLVAGSVAGSVVGSLAGLASRARSRRLARLGVSAAAAGVLAAGALAAVQPAGAYYITPLQMQITFPEVGDGEARQDDEVKVRISLGFDITAEQEGVRWEEISNPRIGYSDGGALPADAIDADDSWLQLSDGLTFAQTGTARVAVAGLRGASVAGASASATGAMLDCGRGRTARTGATTRGECVVTLGRAGELPRVRVPAGIDEGVYRITARVALADSAQFRGLFSADGEVSSLGGERVYQVRAALGVGQTSDVSTVRVHPAAPGPAGAVQWPTEIESAEHEETRVTVSIRNHRGAATDARALDAVILRTRLGWFSDGRCVAQFSRVCQLTTRTLENLGRHWGGEIQGLRLAASSAVGETQVSATVIARDGRAYQSLPMSVHFIGQPVRLDLTEPSTVLADRPYVGTQELSFTLRAFDAAGRQTDLPMPISLSITDEDGIEVNPARAVALREGDRVVVRAVRGLTPGRYGISALNGAMTTTSTFTVSGAPDVVRVLPLDGGAEPRIGETVTFLAHVSDELGTAVVDGTEVRFTTAPSAGQVLSAAWTEAPRTVDGVARAAFTVIGSSSTLVTADAGSARASVEFAGPAPEVVPGGEAASRLALGQVGRWEGTASVTARELLGLAGGRASRAYAWSGTRWVPFGMVGGRALPGAVNFDLATGDLVWLSE